MSGPRVEHLEGGDDTPLHVHLRKPWVLAAVVGAAALVGAGLAVARPWAPPPAAEPSASASPTASGAGELPIDVHVVSTGSTGTVLPATTPGGYRAARMELRVDLVRGDGGRVIGIVGPGVARPFAQGPPLEPGTSSITLAGADFSCPQLVGAAPSDFGLSIEVDVDGVGTRVVQPLPGPDGSQWVGRVQEACAAP